MSDEPELELDDDALAMLRAYRAEERIPADVHERVWSRVRADVAPPAGRWLRYGVVVGALAAAALAVLWVGGQVLRSAPRSPASQAGYEHRADRPEVVEPTAPHAAPSGAMEQATPPSPEPSVPQAARREPAAAPPDTRGTAARRSTADDDRRPSAPDEPSEPSEPTPTAGGTLAAENRLLAQARTALIDGRPERALARLEEHAQRFPDGLLAEEREALRAVALCEAGRKADGEAAAAAFLREHPQAALAERVRNACRE